MKRTALILITVSLFLTACHKDPKEQWTTFYGFTTADVQGHYNANPDESIYDVEYPTEGIDIYDNATIEIIANSESNISLHIVIPSQLSRLFSGSIDLFNESRSVIALNNTSNENLILTVYKNDQGQVRLHGRVQHLYYDSEGVPIKSVMWYFDVIKQG